MSKIFKTTFKVVVLSADHPISNDADIEDVLREMDSGTYIGQVTHDGSDEVPADNVRAALIELANDGTFFDYN